MKDTYMPAASAKQLSYLSIAQNNSRIFGRFDFLKQANLLLEAKILPDAKIVFAEIRRQLSDLDIADATSKALSVGAWNMEFFNWAKANYFIDTYKEIVSRHHFLAVEEVTAPGLAALARSCRYQFYVSMTNNRGQAVGCLIHPRLQVKQHFQYREIVDIAHVPHLRPALRLDLQDSQTGFSFVVVVVHLKSMVGGLKRTSIVRFEQLSRLVSCLEGVTVPVIILGDFNCFLNDTHDTLPLIDDGYALLNPQDQAPTHQLGGRLDGLFCKNMPNTIRLGKYRVHNFWRNQLIGCALSDHGLLTWKCNIGARIY